MKDFFKTNSIEYRRTIPFKDCKIIDSHLIKDGFTPQSVTVFLVPYYCCDTSGRNISLYAAAPDYHLYFKELFGTLIPKLEKEHPKNKFFGYVDSSPIDEVNAAALAGLGVIGDNGLLINEKYGSFVFIGEIISDLTTEEKSTKIKTCTHCGACRSECPKKDICVSRLTQTKGELSSEEIAQIKRGGLAWGCDKCQTVCPLCRDPHKTPIEYFTRDLIFSLDREQLEQMSDEEFERRGFAWKKRSTLERNLKLFDS